MFDYISDGCRGGWGSGDSCQFVRGRRRDATRAFDDKGGCSLCVLLTFTAPIQDVILVTELFKVL